MVIPDDTRPCPCGKKMILEFTGVCLTSLPIQYPTKWKCWGCLREDPGPTIVKRTADQLSMERWREANR